jgi:threonine/homoserine/homoserine lactone efflux protein
MLGITLGFGAMVTACGLGLSGLFRAEPRLHILLKYAGTAYLIYLAWRIANAGSASHDAKQGRPIGFAEAALFTWANPKSWVTAIGALAAYSTLGGSMFVQTLVIAGVLAAACLVSVVMWGAFGAAIARLLVGRRARSLFNYSMACLLVLSLAPIFL